MILFFPAVAGAIASALIQNQLLIFKINRSFFYQIRDQSSNVSLFEGHVIIPEIY